ncbi:MerR family transcriptional regulator [Citricoccus sp. I39-566]|uniref:MerR family transcriptional regulator n=1 Tax=Citricoccus sp. I39-566 TaxID=3073268 RepID=UPI00286ACA5E|nr:MerR family transcriptional regulator [Citricoccus sp. I39-566]WMY78749.1 MerR family transcriptional regulator [Citricoccus sp. I39-566]
MTPPAALPAEAATPDAAASPILRIGHVSRMVGVSPSTIRLWEQEGLIAPARTDSGQRRYSMVDVKRLEQAKRLMSGGQMTLAGVRGALENTAPLSSDSPDTGTKAEVGVRVRLARLAAGLSLRELAQRIEMSPSAVSAFERGVSQPSIGRISQIAHALGVTVPELLGMPPVSDQIVVRRDQRERLPLQVEGVLIENLYSSATALQSQMVTVQPGCGSGEPMVHAGEEFLTVVEGQIEIILDAIERYTLEEGDSMNYASTRPHSYHNRSDRPARVVWVNTPPTF